MNNKGFFEETIQNRVPPHDFNAEKAVLGACLIASEAVSAVMEILTPDDYYKGAHREIFAAIIIVSMKNEPVDILTVGAELDKAGMLEEIGGNYFLTKLANDLPSAANVEAHAWIVKKYAKQRRYPAAGQKLIDIGFDKTLDMDEAEDKVQTVLFDLQGDDAGKGFVSLDETLVATSKQIIARYEKPGTLSGVPTGITDLDKITSGFQSGDLIILAARPSMGKTAAMLQMMLGAAGGSNVPVGSVSLEMPKEALAIRLAANFSGINSHRIRNGDLVKTEIPILEDAFASLKDLPIFIDDKAGQSVLQIRAKARRLVARHNVKAIFVDYLQLIHLGGRVENRQVEVSKISGHLKALAKDLNIPVIALSQLSRSCESRTDKRPLLSDLRESGAIEQDADVVVFLYRDHFYDETAEPNVMEMIIRKHRNGALGNVQVFYDKKTGRIENLADKGLPEIATNGNYSTELSI